MFFSVVGLEPMYSLDIAMKTLKMTVSPELVRACEQFIDEPSTHLETRIITLVRVDFPMSGHRGMCIEWGCVEHGVVDIYVGEDGAILRIDPKSSTMYML